MSLIESREIRKTGLIMLFVFSCLVFYTIWKNLYIFVAFFSTMLLIGLLFVVIPQKMNRFYKVWAKISHYIGKTLTFIILFLAYFLFFVPYAMILKLLKMDPLANPKKLKSYWVEKEEKQYSKERFKDMY